MGAPNGAMLLAFGAGLRRSDLMVPQVGLIELVPGCDLRLLVSRFKTDQHGQSQELAIWPNRGTPALLSDWSTARI